MLTDTMTMCLAHECSRNRARRGRWSDELCWFGRLSTSSSSALLTRASLDRSCRPRSAGTLQSGGTKTVLRSTASGRGRALQCGVLQHTLQQAAGHMAPNVRAPLSALVNRMCPFPSQKRHFCVCEVQIRF